MTGSDLDIVQSTLDRDIRRADTGEAVDVVGILADLSTLSRTDIMGVMDGLLWFPDRQTKSGLLRRIKNRLTAFERSSLRNSV